MMKKISLLIMCVSLIGFSNQTENENLKKQLENLFESSKKVNLATAEKGKARAEIEQAVDWEGIAKLCLGEANSKKYSKGFSDFRNLLKEVITKTAFSRMDKFWENGTTAVVDKVEVKGGTAHVGAKFNSKDETFALDYYLSKKGNKWMIHDIAFEDMKYSVNIKEQLDAFLKEKNFNDLLEKLRKRRDELDKPSKNKSS